jgi:hypothetical protein
MFACVCVCLRKDDSISRKHIAVNNNLNHDAVLTLILTLRRRNRLNMAADCLIQKSYSEVVSGGECCAAEVVEIVMR